MVLDAGGHVIVLKREDGAGIMRPDLAIAKAYGALGMVHIHMFFAISKMSLSHLGCT